MTALGTTLQLPAKPTLTVTMLTDWHVGCGMGRPGSVDRLVVRDDDGLPYVPAKTLTGMWRDACERLAFGLDVGVPGKWSQWVKYLFGDQPAHRNETVAAQFPGPAAVSIRSARLPGSLRDRLRAVVAPGDEEGSLDHESRQELQKVDAQRQTLRVALTFVKPGVKIDSRNGRALDEHLRFEEMARCGTVLTASFEVQLPNEPAQREAAIALLVASTRLVERLGGKRRRGAGRCELKIEGLQVAAALDWLESHSQAPDLPRLPDGPEADVTAAPATADLSEWVAIPFTLELHSALSVSSRTIGNVVESLDFVPGTFLLPHFTAGFKRLGIDVRRAIASGDLRVLPATVEIDGQAGRPVPLALFAKKEGGGLDNPQTLVNRLIQREEGADQLKQCRGGFIGQASEGTMPRHETVPMTMRTHNTIDEEQQRPTTVVGGVYSYEAISARRLRGELRLHKKLADELTREPDWRTRLEGPCRLGRSKKDDYGAVTLTLDLPGSGELKSIAPARPCDGRQLYVWVVSDVLLRDERMRPAVTVDDVGQELERRLDVKLTKCDNFSRVRRTESWHVPWGLPRPSLATVQAGSCMVFECDRVPIPAALTRVEAEGIGERTAEGYGQVSFNDMVLMRRPNDLNPPRGPDTIKFASLPAISKPDSILDYARQIEEEVWREEIRRAVLHVAQEEREQVLGWRKEKPPMSQLGGLRGVVQQVRSFDDGTLVLNWLRHIEGNKWRADKWNGSIAKVKRLFEQQQVVWDKLGPAEWPTLTVGAVERLKRDLWPLAFRSLIDACIRAHKRELDQRRLEKSSGHSPYD